MVSPLDSCYYPRLFHSFTRSNHFNWLSSTASTLISMIPFFRNLLFFILFITFVSLISWVYHPNVCFLFEIVFATFSKIRCPSLSRFFWTSGRALYSVKQSLSSYWFCSLPYLSTNFSMLCYYHFQALTFNCCCNSICSFPVYILYCFCLVSTIIAFVCHFLIVFFIYTHVSLIASNFPIYSLLYSPFIPSTNNIGLYLDPFLTPWFVSKFFCFVSYPYIVSVFLLVC